MKAIFRRTLIKMRGQIMGWGGGIFLLGLLVVPLYDVILAQAEQMERMLKSLPPQLLAFFGGVESIVTPEGYLSARYFSLMPVILGIFAVLAGSGLLASDEEHGTLDLLLAHPLSRSALFLGRLLAFLVATLLIHLLGWLGVLLPALGEAALEVPPSALLLPFLALLAEIILFGALSLLLSQLLPSRRLAAMAGGALLLASYFISSLSRLDQNLEWVARFSPLTYYQSGEAILGLNLAWFLSLLAAALLCTFVAWLQFERRDIRVSGEGSWRLNLQRGQPSV